MPLRVAVMGCVVNGPGEAREADLGVASGNGKGQIFVKGEVIKTVPESQIVETLIEEALRLAEADGRRRRPRRRRRSRPRGQSVRLRGRPGYPVRSNAPPTGGGAAPDSQSRHYGDTPT